MLSGATRTAWLLCFLLGASLAVFPISAIAAPAEPVILLCGTNTSTPCGTAANPVVTTGGGGGVASDVNLTEVAGAAVKTGAGTAAGSIRVELPNDGTGKVGLNAGSAVIGATWTANRLEVTPTVQNAAYASGNNIGGLVTFTLPRTASGYLQSVGIQFIGGATTAINAYCFDSNPTGSTFTDKSTFTIAAADEAKRINKTGYSLTPSAVTGDTVTGAAVDNLAKPFVSTGTIYCAYASTGTFTPASTTDMRVNITYVQSAQ